MTTGQAAHAVRLREISDWNWETKDKAALLAGAAALDEVATLRARVQELEQALRDVEKHHAILNGQVGRGEERSTTLAIVRAALGTTPPETP